MALKDYKSKRNFRKTPEPSGDKKTGKGSSLKFVVQLHHATRRHFDLRLEWGGVLKSWAVPKGPSLNPLDSRLAVHVEDHPLDYGDFEGTIPKGNYGAGTVQLWDRGVFTVPGVEGRAATERRVEKDYREGKLKFSLHGEKLNGTFNLVRIKSDPKNWLLIKKRDGYAKYQQKESEDISVKTGRTIEQIKAGVQAGEKQWVRENPKGEKAAFSLDDLSGKLPKTTLKPVPSDLPHKIQPMLPCEMRRSIDPKGFWFFGSEGGVRAIAVIEKGRVKLSSKQGLSLKEKFPQIVAALKAIKGTAVLDGELNQGKYLVWDLLYWEGNDYREMALEDRYQVLQTLPIFGGLIALHRSGKVPMESPLLYARHPKSPYVSGISDFWLRLSQRKTSKARLTHGSKIFWKEENLTKADLFRYYESIADLIVPYLIDRPQSLNRHPNGIEGESFYQKDWTGFSPSFVKTVPIFSRHSEHTVNYLLCQNRETLLFLINLGCIEINPWLSRVGSLENPDYVVIDLDPDTNSFYEVVQVAKRVHEELNRLDVTAFCKTSGATGIHIYIPTDGKITYAQGREFARLVCERVHTEFPKNTSLLRTPGKRRGKIYLDFMQNSRGQTLAAPYCVRPRPHATVSAPLKWEELNKSLSPEQFTLHTMAQRINKVGDLWSKLSATQNDLLAATALLLKSAP